MYQKSHADHPENIEIGIDSENDVWSESNVRSDFPESARALNNIDNNTNKNVIIGLVPI